ncbi:MAG TPA: TRAP transporter substrate-binding protein [Vicinamibacterales bacterium]|nr:TRAP transporter substrate-binding protein [Vicinamibacterales bacterium]
MPLTRRSFVATAVGSLTVFARSMTAQNSALSFAQYHNQTPASSLHKRLVEMWSTIERESQGRIRTTVFAQNNNIQGSDPAALKALVAGEIQFFTLMGGILGTLVPAAEVQQVPFAFRSAADAHRAMDGPLGAYLIQEMAADGIHGFRIGAFDNGMREITAHKKIAMPADLAGLKMRVPAGQLVADTFKAFGCEPVIINSDSIYAALKDGRADAQENPLTLADQFKLYEVVKYVAMTDHMWSGFNLLAHRPTWQRIPADLQAVIDRNVAKYVRLQRQDQIAANTRLRTELPARGLEFNTPDPAPFRKQLSGVHATWREKLGSRCWKLLEDSVGKIQT